VLPSAAMRATKWMVWGVGAAALFALGCGGPITYEIKGSAKAPEVDGKIIAEPNRDAGMTTLKISLEHLAPPERLGEGSTFVVWTKDPKGKWHRLGALKYDESGRKATLEGGSVPVISFDLEITVEKDAQPDEPSKHVVLGQQVN
jgi:hypothetical protein